MMLVHCLISINEIHGSMLLSLYNLRGETFALVTIYWDLLICSLGFWSILNLFPFRVNNIAYSMWFFILQCLRTSNTYPVSHLILEVLRMAFYSDCRSCGIPFHFNLARSVGDILIFVNKIIVLSGAF